MANNNFRDFYNDDANVSPAERAKIEFEVELIGKLIEAREAQGLTQKQLAEAAGIKQLNGDHLSILGRSGIISICPCHTGFNKTIHCCRYFGKCFEKHSYLEVV